MTDKPKMAPSSDAPPGIETDDKGNTIPFDQRTEDDKKKTQQGSLENIHGKPQPLDDDPAGQQGGTERHGKSAK